MNILILPGDGIGPEICAAAERVLATADRCFRLGLAIQRDEVGFTALRRSGSTCPASVLERAAEADGVVLGPVSHNEYPAVADGGINPSGSLRIALDLYANLRPAKTRPGIPALSRDADLLIARENTEGFYADRNMLGGPGEFMPVAGVGLALRKVTAAASRRIAQAGFRAAMQRRGRVTAVHKANVMRLTDGIFLEETRRVAAECPTVRYDEMLVDAAAAWLVRDARRFDVIVTTNMFGDILSDEASELTGSLGLGCSLNAGDGHAMAQAQHGSAPDIAGEGLANPISLVLSTAMLLSWLGERHDHAGCRAAALAVEAAAERTLAEPGTRTRDLGGTASTETVTDRLCQALESDAEGR